MSHARKAILADWPVHRPADWVQWVNQPIGSQEFEKLETSETVGRPFGDDSWTACTAARAGRMDAIRNEGRPREVEKGRKER